MSKETNEIVEKDLQGSKIGGLVLFLVIALVFSGFAWDGYRFAD